MAEGAMMIGSKLSVSKKIKAIFVILPLVVLAQSMYFINSGINHWFPQGMLRLSEAKWQEGKYFESIKWYISGYESAYDAGVRWFIAGFYFRQEANYLKRDQLGDALKSCRHAQSIVDGHDDEGAIDFNCFMIEEKMKTQK